MSAPTETSDSKQTVKTATQTATEDVCGAEAAAGSDTVCEHPAFGKQSKSAFEMALDAAAYSIEDTVYNSAALKDLPKDLSNRADTVVKESGLSEREFDDKTHAVKWLVNIRSQANFMTTDSVTQKTMLNFKTTIKASVVDKVTEEEKDDLIGRALKQLLEDQSRVKGLLDADIADIPQELRLFDPTFDVDYTDNELNIYCVYDIHRLDKDSHRTSVVPRNAQIYFSVKKTSNGEWGVFDHKIQVAETEKVASGGEEEA